jgi:hypothetical protein
MPPAASANALAIDAFISVLRNIVRSLNEWVMRLIAQGLEQDVCHRSMRRNGESVIEIGA